MNSSDLTKLAVAAGMLYGVWKFAPNDAVKAMALGVAGVIAAKKLPFVKDVI